MDSFTSAHVFGLGLVDQGHFAAEEIQENCGEMTLVKDELMESWKEKQVELSQSYELQVRLVYARIAYLSYTGKERPQGNISHFLVARGTVLVLCRIARLDWVGLVLCRIARWDWVGVVSKCTMGLGRCCVELHDGTGSVLCRTALWDWVGFVSNCTMGLGRCCIELRTVLITSV